MKRFIFLMIITFFIFSVNILADENPNGLYQPGKTDINVRVIRDNISFLNQDEWIKVSSLKGKQEWGSTREIISKDEIVRVSIQKNWNNVFLYNGEVAEDTYTVKVLFKTSVLNKVKSMSKRNIGEKIAFVQGKVVLAKTTIKKAFESELVFSECDKETVGVLSKEMIRIANQ